MGAPRRRLAASVRRVVLVAGAVWLGTVAAALVGLVLLPVLTRCDPWASFRAGLAAAGCTGALAEVAGAMLAVTIPTLFAAPVILAAAAVAGAVWLIARALRRP